MLNNYLHAKFKSQLQWKMRIKIKLKKNLKKVKSFYYSASMVFGFILNDWKLFAILRLIGKEFQTMAPLYAKQFCPCFAFNRGGLIFNSQLQSNLFVTEDTLLKRVVR